MYLQYQLIESWCVLKIIEEFVLWNCVTSTVLPWKLAASSFTLRVFSGHPEARIITPGPCSAVRCAASTQSPNTRSIGRAHWGRAQPPTSVISHGWYWLMNSLHSVRGIDFGHSCLLHGWQQATCWVSPRAASAWTAARKSGCRSEATWMKYHVTMQRKTAKHATRRENCKIPNTL